MIRYLTAGESHGPSLTVIMEGVPAGVKLEEKLLQQEMARRQQGVGRGGRMAIETDTVRVTSGVRFGETLGSPLTLVVENRDHANWLDKMAPFGEAAGEAVTAVRPGHADLTGVLKYDRQDARDILERASARETAARVAAGGVCKQLLAALGVQVRSHVVNLGGVESPLQGMAAFRAWRQPDPQTACLDEAASLAMKQRVEEAKNAGDTLGGVIEVFADGLWAGLGTYAQGDRRLDARLAAAMVSIPAIKGVEFGEGFQYANLPGSQAHDEIFHADSQGFFRRTNHAGGLEGGMSNGEVVWLRLVMKPIPTLMQPLATVDLRTKAAVDACKERSDVCAVPAAAVVAEAMLAITLAQVISEQFGGDCFQDLKQNIDAYKQRLEKRA